MSDSKAILLKLVRVCHYIRKVKKHWLISWDYMAGKSCFLLILFLFILFCLQPLYGRLILLTGKGYLPLAYGKESHSSFSWRMGTVEVFTLTSISSCSICRVRSHSDGCRGAGCPHARTTPCRGEDSMPFGVRTLPYSPAEDRRAGKQLGPVIVGGAVELKGRVAGSQVRGCLCRMPASARHPCGLYRPPHCRSPPRWSPRCVHSGQNGDLPDKVNGFIALNHIDISIFKFIDDPVFHLCNNSEIPYSIFFWWMMEPAAWVLTVQRLGYPQAYSFQRYILSGAGTCLPHSYVHCWRQCQPCVFPALYSVILL